MEFNDKRKTVEEKLVIFLIVIIFLIGPSDLNGQSFSEKVSISIKQHISVSSVPTEDDIYDFIDYELESLVPKVLCVKRDSIFIENRYLNSGKDLIQVNSASSGVDFGLLKARKTKYDYNFWDPLGYNPNERIIWYLFNPFLDPSYIVASLPETKLVDVLSFDANGEFKVVGSFENYIGLEFNTDYYQLYESERSIAIVNTATEKLVMLEHVTGNTSFFDLSKLKEKMGEGFELMGMRGDVMYFIDTEEFNLAFVELHNKELKILKKENMKLNAAFPTIEINKECSYYFDYKTSLLYLAFFEIETFNLNLYEVQIN